MGSALTPLFLAVRSRSGVAFPTVPLSGSGETELFPRSEGLTEEELSLGLELDELGVGSGFMVLRKQRKLLPGRIGIAQKGFVENCT
ncbi:hypothetical protein [Oscillatoria sp. HE19RPO]|uniref:hypothetical protein n=1 Tax=Oscillatoria sp. HE19RPO TaxID=2954806 RepID=UPI0020C2F99D|nr:hypothetical protein [Oscillatoria sp. HE19RPO]